MPDHLALRRERVAKVLNLTDEILIVVSGSPIPLPENSDQTYPFIADADYFYLTEDHCVGGIIAFDPRLGPTDGWVHFVPEVTEAERVWEGRVQVPGRRLEEFDAWIAPRINRRIAMFGAPLRSLSGDPVTMARVRPLLTHARRLKDETEIALVRKAAAATAAGYKRVAEFLRAGVSERQIQIELEAEFFRNGADQCGFGTIVGTGPNSAVLHFSPGSRLVRNGDFVLIDSGAQISRYTADVTRTFLVGDAAGPAQKDLYQVVLSAQERAITRCLPGVEWKDVHLSCAVDMVAGLVSMGLMKGNPSSLVEQEAHSLFFPHGLGHMVGLGVRDGSGMFPGRVKDPRPCLRSLRMDLPLEDGYLVTVEPGLYFIPAILQDKARRTRYNDCVRWDKVDALIGLGGVRIEDDVLVRPKAPEVLTAAIPKKL